MADTRRTPVTLARAIRLCLFGVFAPARLAAEEAADSAARDNYSGRAGEVPRAFVVRRAFWTSLCLVAGSTVAGYVAGRMSAALCGAPPAQIVISAQVAGAGLLLWGTIFVRGC